MCLYSKLVKNPKYKKNKKNGGIIPPLPLDRRILYVPIKCGKCMECKKAKANEWNVRMMEELKTSKNGIFVTLTFSNESIIELTKNKGSNYYKRGKKKGQKKEVHKYDNIESLEGYELDNAIAAKATRLFLERWRKKYGDMKDIKHWLVTELGHNGTENIHLHGIIWTNKNPEEIRNIWKYGYVWLSSENQGFVNEQTINYITKYITKTDKIHKEYNPKILNSAGIGKNYTNTGNAEKNKYKPGETNETYRDNKGMKRGLPIYWRNNIYTEEEREKLWIEKLNQNTRYVDGNKIDISKTEEQYYKALKYARKKNIELGYGDDSINWDRKKYENDRRNMNYKIRKKNKDTE